MTTNRSGKGFPIVGALAALAIWFGGMSSAAIFFQPAMVTVFGPQPTVIEAVAGLGGELVSVGTGRVTATTSSRDFVSELYARGAWLVWPSFRAGCSGAQVPKA